MTIQLNLARGLKERFFREYSEELFSDLREFATNNFKAINRNNFEEKTPLIIEKSKGSIIKSIVSGEKRNRYLAIETLSNKIEIEKSEWSESGLHGMSVIMKVGFNHIKATPLKYIISGHSILRIFERTKTISKDFQYSKIDVINELTQVSLWSSFWTTYAMTYSNPKLWESLSYIIPTPNGVFLCNLNATEMHIDVRTFVDQTLLSDTQNSIRRDLFNIGEQFNLSPLAFGTSMVQFEPNIFTGLFYVMTKFLTAKMDIESFLNQMTKDITGEATRAEAKNQINNLLVDSSKIITDDFYNLISTLETKEIISIIRDSQKN